MSKVKKRMRFISNCINCLEFVQIVRYSDSGNGNLSVYMTYISEEEEKEISQGKRITVVRANKTFTIEDSLCYAYGELDLSPDSDDLKIFNKIDWFKNLNIREFVPSEYDYEHHCAESDIKCGRWFDTRNISTYMPYLYGCIGKPKRVAIFREYFDISAVNKAYCAKYYQNHKERLDKINTAARKKVRSKKKEAKLSKITFNFK